MYHATLFHKFTGRFRGDTLPAGVVVGVLAWSCLAGTLTFAADARNNEARNRSAVTGVTQAGLSQVTDDSPSSSRNMTPSDTKSKISPQVRDWAPTLSNCGPMTIRSTPPTDPVGTPLCHRAFSGDCYGENWRLQRWDDSTCSNRFHAKTHSHSLGMERFLSGLCGKRPRGYYHDTSGFPLRNFHMPQSNDPAVAATPSGFSYVYDYPQYIYQPNVCRTGPNVCPPLVPLLTSNMTPAKQD